MGLPALRPLSNGEILDGAFTLYRRNFVAFVGTAFLFTAPALAARVAGNAEAAAILNWVATFAMMGALVKIAAEATLGRTPAIGAAVNTGLRKAVPLAVNYVIFAIFVLLGVFALIIGAFFVAIMGFAIAQVVVLENRWDGFARSRMLAKKSWGKVSILLLLSAIITFLPGSVLVGGAVFAAFKTTPDPRLLAASPMAKWIDLASLLLQCLTTPFSQCVLTLLYFDQRVRKEGLGIELQAAELARSAPMAPSAPSAG